MARCENVKSRSNTSLEGITLKLKTNKGRDLNGNNKMTYGNALK